MSLAYIINKLIHLDPNINQYLRPLANKSISLTCTDFPTQTLFCLFEENYIQLTSAKPEQVDIIITGPLIGLVTLAVKKQAANLRACQININGDVLAAEALQKLLFNLDIDWEEELSKYTGDVIAYRAIAAFKQIRSYQKQTSLSLEAMITEYLQEESGLFPTHCEVNSFMQEVDQLRMDSDRLQARIKVYESA